ncbi:MAG: hypothetical protein PVF58_17675 [Candidatus Methanofastidiosia archaeon]|jgi:hypothetical protein
MKKFWLIFCVILVLPLVQGEDWDSYESEHFIFYYHADELTIEDIKTIVETEEELFDELTELLSVEYTGKIEYYLYGKRKDFEGIPGAYCVGNEIRFLCEFCVNFCKEGLNDAHEMTHAIANQIGIQHGFLAEGLAVYVEEYYVEGANLHGIIKILHTENRLTPLETLVDGFWSDILYNYDIVGSFTAYLVEEYGMDTFKVLYTKDCCAQSFEEVYGKSLQVLEQEWLQVVEHAEVTQTEKDIVQYRDDIKEGLAIYFDVGFNTVKYGSYPARAEEGICLFRAQIKENRENAFSHLDQFNEGMVAWKKAMEAYQQGLEHDDFEKKALLFEEAWSLYQIAGDEEFMAKSEEYATAYRLLEQAETHIDRGEVGLADEKVGEAKSILGGGSEEFHELDQRINAYKDRAVEGFESGFIIVVILVMCVKILFKIR